MVFTFSHTTKEDIMKEIKDLDVSKASQNNDITIKTIKDTHRAKTLSNKTPTLTRSANMDNWVTGTSNQLFIRDY